jgi:hypothetical protein
MEKSYRPSARVCLQKLRAAVKTQGLVAVLFTREIIAAIYLAILNNLAGYSCTTARL